MKRYKKGLIAVVTLILVVSMLTGCVVTVNEEVNMNQKKDKILGYAIILHYDGEEHVEFTEYSYNSTGGGVITIRDINGRLISSNNITLIFY